MTTETNNEIEIYPCGCLYEKRNNDLFHYCKPSCKFDSKKVGKSLAGSYHFVAWSEEVARRFYAD